jgi:hypothetical protein
MIALIAFQLIVTDPSPLDPRLHGPHTHGLGSYSTLAECQKRGREAVALMNRS